MINNTLAQVLYSVGMNYLNKNIKRHKKKKPHRLKPMENPNKCNVHHAQPGPHTFGLLDKTLSDE